MLPARWLRARRFIDAFIVVLALPILCPVALMSALSVWIADRRWPFVRLRRVGRFGTTLWVWKIRTMRADAGSGASITSSGDSRITRVGALLRHMRLDEIPQVYDVLAGRMALIGPRPEDPRFVDDSEEWQRALAARPGIAGVTQVIASDWERRNLDGEDAEQKYRQIAMPAKVLVDGWYVENASPRLDGAVLVSLAMQFLGGSSTTPVHRTVTRAVPGAEALFTDPVLQTNSWIDSALGGPDSP